jgi:hypothetical protein
MSGRIACLKTAGLSQTRLAAAQTINAIRNARAHGDKECIDKADVDSLLKALRLVLGEDYAQGPVHDLTTDPYGEWDYRTMDWKGRFCMLGVTAVALVASIENEFENTRSGRNFQRSFASARSSKRRRSRRCSCS